MKSFVTLVMALLYCGAANADAPPSEIDKHFGNPKRLGSAEVSFFGFDLYSAELWTNGSQFSFNKPFALSLTYSRSFSADTLAQKTIEEVARIERVNVETHSQMEALESCFADVRSGDRITAVRKDDHSSRFFVNGQFSCDFTYPEFSKRFFGIWLGDQTRDPASRAKLLGNV